MSWRASAPRALAAALFLLSSVADARAEPPRTVTLFTALPLMWGEGGPDAVLSGAAQRSPVLADLTVRAIDQIAPETLGRDVLIIAQPRAMAPQELVALDGWVRGGGRVLIFADPGLAWPSAYPLGDPRRAPPVTLLDPLLTHWGLTLHADPLGVATLELMGYRVATVDHGHWQGAPGCDAPDPLLRDCRIGKGRAILVADADLLDNRLVTESGAATTQWLNAMLNALELGAALEPESRFPKLWMLAGAILVLLGCGVFLAKQRRTLSEH